MLELTLDLNPPYYQTGVISSVSIPYICTPSLVTATTDDGGHSYNVHVNVSASSSGGGGSTTVPVTGVSLNKSSTSLTVGKTEILTATVTPTNATNKAVSTPGAHGLFTCRTAQTSLSLCNTSFRVSISSR